MARLEVSNGRQSCEVDLLKEAIGPPVHLEIAPVLALDDAVGLKMRALHDRAAHRDFIDVHAAATRGGYTYADLERVAAVHTPHFAPADLADRLEAVELRDDRTFYGMASTTRRSKRSADGHSAGPPTFAPVPTSPALAKAGQGQTGTSTSTSEPVIPLVRRCGSRRE